MPGAELPDAAITMLRARTINGYCHTHYSLEEVAEMPDLLFEVLGAVRQGLEPIKAEKRR